MVDNRGVEDMEAVKRIWISLESKTKQHENGMWYLTYEWYGLAWVIIEDRYVADKDRQW